MHGRKCPPKGVVLLGGVALLEKGSMSMWGRALRSLAQYFLSMTVS